MMDSGPKQEDKKAPVAFGLSGLIVAVPHLYSSQSKVLLDP
jgi:hypothetical protein